MFNRTRIARAIVASLVIITISAISFASPWTKALSLLGFASAESSPNIVEAAPATYFAAGTCDAVPAGNVEVEGTILGTTPVAYATLKAAFDAINAGTHTGAVTIDVCGNTTETASAILNASGSGSASYTSIAISPVGGARTISGSMLGAMIDLNGADNVTINGVNSGGTSLELDNQNTGNSYTLRFIADASNNTIQNSTIRGANSASATNGVILFSTGTTTGNDNNTISNNNITSSVGGNPQIAIYSGGTSAAIDNSGNTITGNNISDYFNASGATSGISLGATGNSAWTITNNKLFQTATRVYTSGTTHNGINIAVGSGYTISGNIIGFANSSGTGTTNMVGNSVALTGTFPSSYTTTGTANATRYIAINAAFTAAGTVSEIQNNTISGFALFSSSGATTANGVFCGINVTSGNANIGTTTGNTIGSTSGQGAIYTAVTTGGGVVVGIYATSANTVSIQNNAIGAVDAVGTTTSLSGAFTGIDTAGTGGIFSISSNTIGNSTADNIRTGYTLSGGSLSNAGTFTSTTGTTSPMVGIRSAATGTTLAINSNTFRGWANGTTAGGALTGITATGANTSSVTINNNLLGTSGLGWMRWAFANTGGAVTGISMTGSTTATSHSIQSNDFQGIVYSVSGTSSHTYINKTSGTATGDTSTIASNTFTNLSVNTTGSVTFISQSYTASSTSTKNTNSNSIVTGFAKPAAGGTVTFIIDNGSSVSGAQSNCQNNNFSNGTLTGATGITGISFTDGGTAPTRTVTGNTINNWTTGAATVNLLNFTYWNGVSSLSNNTVTNIAGQGAITGLTMGSTVSTATSITISGNTFSGFTSSGTGGAVNGISNSNTSTLINITSNTFSNFSSTAASVNGISNNGSTAVNITGNTINTLSSINAAAVVYGINNAAGSTVGINKNKIYDLSGSTAAAIVSGLNLTTGTTFNISNNLIGDLRAPAATGLNAINGINASATATYNVFHNTIYLNATSSGTTFGNSCITFSSTATTFNLRNNILVNTSTPGTNASNLASNGIAATLRRSSGTAATVPANYNTASNNNDFWVNPTAGTNNHTTYVEGTSTITNSMNTFAQMKTFMGNRDQASFGENPTFLSTTGSNANFLHIDTTVATQIESGAGTGTGITDDYDGQTRNVSTPDVGADEFNGIGLDLNGPSITYTTIGNTSCSNDITLSATITDSTGVNTTAGTKPRLYYRRSAGPNADSNAFNDNTPGTAGWKYVEATNASSPFSFTTNFALLNGGAGIALTNVVEYFVVAQDTAGTPNVGIYAGSFATAPTSVALTAANFAVTGAPSFTVVAAGLSGTVTIGAAGTYPSLTGATGLFAAINANGLSGPLTANIVDASVGETGATALNAINYNGCAAGPYAVTIRPAASNVTALTGSVSSGALIKLNGADSVTIDGSNSGGTDRSLTITNTSATSPTVISVQSLGTGIGATDNTIKNVNISTGSNAATSYGIWAGSATTGTAGDDNDNLTIQNNAISKAYYGIRVDANATGLNNNLTITGNSIGSTTSGSEVLFSGVTVSQATGASIGGNTIFNLIPTTAVDPAGIAIGTGVVSSTINGNIIYDISPSNTGGYGGRGITVNTGNASSNLTISNNSISNIKGSGWSSFTSDSIAGILIGNTSSSTGGLKIYYNSVNLGSGSFAGNTSGTLSGAFVVAQSGPTGLDVRNNVFATNLVNSAASGAKSYAIYSGAANTAFTTIDYNDYYVSGTQGVLGFLTSDRTDLTGIQTGFGQNTNSRNDLPLFNSATDLRPQLGSLLLGRALSLAPTITTDLLGVTRSTGTAPAGPTIGAYENAVDSAGPSISYTALASTGSTANRVLTATLVDATGTDTGGNAPRIYFKKNAGAYFSTACVLATGTVLNGTWDCTIDNSLIGGVVVTDTVSYYVIAQDTIGNVSANPSTGLVASNVNTVTTPPTTPNSYAILTVINSFPYSNDFETNNGGWTAGFTAGSATDWVYGTPAKTQITGAHAGTKAWVTKLTGTYTTSTTSTLTSPLIDMSSLTGRPTVSFWSNFKTESGYDAGIVEYSIDGGSSWTKVDANLGTGGTFNTTDSTGWYNSSSTNGPIVQPKFSGTSTSYTGASAGWIQSTTLLPAAVIGQANVRLRYTFGADSITNDEGWAIDDVAIIPPSPGNLQLSSATYAGNENTTVPVIINRVSGSLGAVDVTLTLADVSAIGGASCGGSVDYVNGGPYLISFADGETTKTQNVSLCPDATIDPAETFTATISAPTNGAGLGTPTVATITIGDVPPPLSGTYTVGSGGNYPSLTNAGGIFEALNQSGVSGQVFINIISDLSGETGTHQLNDVTAGNNLTIRPVGGPWTITGSSAGSLIVLNGADNVVIDGSGTDANAGPIVGGDATLRKLTITNTNTGTSSAVVSIHTGTNGATNNIIKNINVIGSSSTAGTLNGIEISGNAVGTVGADNDNNRITNCSVQKSLYGIFAAGATAANPNVQNFINRNDLSATGANSIGRFGIYAVNVDYLQIQENSVGGISTSLSGDVVGIGVGTVDISTSTSASGGITNGTIHRNKVNGVVSTNATGFSAVGIAAACTTCELANNMVTGVLSPATSPDFPAGIFVVSGAATSTNVFHNSVSMTGDRGSVTSQMPSYAIAITGADTPVGMINNVLYTTQTASGGGTAAKSYALGVVTANLNFSSEGNDYWSTGANDGGIRVGSLAASAGTDYATLSAWQSATSKDNAVPSQEVDPQFVNPANDLHLNNAMTNTLVNAGYNNTWPQVDFDNDPRPLTTVPQTNLPHPDIGADEVVQAASGVIPAGTFYNAYFNGGDTLAGNVTVTNKLYLNGINVLGANVLTLGCNATVSGAGATSFIDGAVKKDFCATGAFEFPVGQNQYSKVGVTITALGTNPSSLTVTPWDATLGGFPPATSLSRNWNLEETGDLTADLLFYYDDTDVNGDESDYRVYKRAGNGVVTSECSTPLTCVDIGLNRLGPVSGVSSFSRWTGAGPLAPTAADVSLSGRVTTADGRGVTNAVIVLTGNSLPQPIMVKTGSFGYYRFENLEAGETYVVTVNSKRFTFSVPSRVVSVPDNVSNIDFVAMPE